MNILYSHKIFENCNKSVKDSCRLCRFDIVISYSQVSTSWHYFHYFNAFCTDMWIYTEWFSDIDWVCLILLISINVVMSEDRGGRIQLPRSGTMWQQDDYGQLTMKSPVMILPAIDVSAKFW